MSLIILIKWLVVNFGLPRTYGRLRKSLLYISLCVFGFRKDHNSFFKTFFDH